jgi:hypothetical protein
MIIIVTQFYPSPFTSCLNILFSTFLLHILNLCFCLTLGETYVTLWFKFIWVKVDPVAESCAGDYEA